MFTSENTEKPTKSGATTIINKRMGLLVKDKNVIRDEEGRFLAVPIRTLGSTYGS